MRRSNWLACALLALAGAPHPLAAQAGPLPLAVVGQVVDEVLRAIVSPDSSLTNMTARERGLYLDYERTLAAFGYPDDAAARAALGLKSLVTAGTGALLEDCNQLGTKPCDRLGISAYVSADLRSRSDSELVVALEVAWPSRGDRTYVRGITTGGHVYLSWFAMDVHLRHASDGSWRFARIGKGIVG